MKRDEHWRAFGKEWFADHQRGLLWLLNAPLLGRWFKWVMRIRSCDVGCCREILAIQPHCYTVRGDELGTLTTDFRTHWKYAKRLYFAFRPLWWMLHWWDAAIADMLVPQWSFGFATLTIYPDPDPEVTSVDGFVAFDSVLGDQDWATVIAHAGDTADDAAVFGNAMGILAGNVSLLWDGLFRSIFLFDTSSLRSSGGVQSAILSLFGSSKTDNLGITPDLNIYSSAPALNTLLQDVDYSTLGSTPFSSVLSYSGFLTSSYNDFTLNGAGLTAINANGVSKFGSRNANYDVAAVVPTWTSLLQSHLLVGYADQSGNTNDPKLAVTHIASSAIPPRNITRPALFRPGLAR